MSDFLRAMALEMALDAEAIAVLLVEERRRLSPRFV